MQICCSLKYLFSSKLKLVADLNGAKIKRIINTLKNVVISKK